MLSERQYERTPLPIYGLSYLSHSDAAHPFELCVMDRPRSFGDGVLTVGSEAVCYQYVDVTILKRQKKYL